MDMSADMQHVLWSLVVNVETPVFRRQPVTGWLFLEFQAQSIASWRRQKVKSLQTHPEVIRAAGTESVFVVVPRLVPVEPADQVSMHEHDPVWDGNHWNWSLSGNRQSDGVVLHFIIWHVIQKCND